MKKPLQRFMGSGPLQGVAVKFDVLSLDGMEIVMIAADREALQQYIEVLGLPPLVENQMEDVLLVEKSAMTSMQLINPETGKEAGLPVPGSGLTH